MLFIVFLDSKTVKTYKNLGFVANYIQKPIKTNGFLLFFDIGSMVCGAGINIYSTLGSLLQKMNENQWFFAILDFGSMVCGAHKTPLDGRPIKFNRKSMEFNSKLIDLMENQ